MFIDKDKTKQEYSGVISQGVYNLVLAKCKVSQFKIFKEGSLLKKEVRGKLNP
ncbi:hypothetical protein KQI89_01095 [Clostridium sp. MSJ-4]|uniref:Uncharacterized protein n=1 Tax=Clostridium simiarum TaxID=2841506 RepID=A0ABS6EW55_9CLOT|nr:hypothetical protein [Clostridium simiarum]